MFPMELGSEPQLQLLHGRADRPNVEGRSVLGGCMIHRELASLIAVIAIVTLGPAPAAGQSRAAATGATSSLRAPDGKPSLQGNWDFRTITPLERPANQASKVLSENEAAAVQKDAE